MHPLIVFAVWTVAIVAIVGWMRERREVKRAKEIAVKACDAAEKALNQAKEHHNQRARLMINLFGTAQKLDPNENPYGDETRH